MTPGEISTPNPCKDSLFLLSPAKVFHIESIVSTLCTVAPRAEACLQRLALGPGIELHHDLKVLEHLYAGDLL
jgi:hypothetical protein